MSDILKPCPFCGSSFVEISRYGNSKVSTCYNCNDCGAALETSETFNHGDRWNSRAESPMQKLANEMYEMLKEITESYGLDYGHTVKALSILEKARGEQ